MLEQRFQVSDLLITHAIPNHFGGAQSIVELHRSLGLQEPVIHKKLDGNRFERLVMRRNPELQKHTRPMKEADKFIVEEENLVRVLETPGHRLDHCSFSLTNKLLQQCYLFPGDLILGSVSVSMDDLDLYLQDL